MSPVEVKQLEKEAKELKEKAEKLKELIKSMTPEEAKAIMAKLFGQTKVTFPPAKTTEAKGNG